MNATFVLLLSMTIGQQLPASASEKVASPGEQQGVVAGSQPAQPDLNNASERTMDALLPKVADGDAVAGHDMVRLFCGLDKDRRKELHPYVAASLRDRETASARWALKNASQCVQEEPRPTESQRRRQLLHSRVDFEDTPDKQGELSLQQPLQTLAMREATEHFVYGAIFANAAVLSGIGTVGIMVQLIPTALAAIAISPQQGVVYGVVGALTVLAGIGATAIFWTLSSTQFESMEAKLDQM